MAKSNYFPNTIQIHNIVYIFIIHKSISALHNFLSNIGKYHYIDAHKRWHAQLTVEKSSYWECFFHQREIYAKCSLASLVVWQIGWLIIALVACLENSRLLIYTKIIRGRFTTLPRSWPFGVNRSSHDCGCSSFRG